MPFAASHRRQCRTGPVCHPWLSLWESWLSRKGRPERVRRSNTRFQPSNGVPSQSACSADSSPKGRAKGAISASAINYSCYSLLQSLNTILNKQLRVRLFSLFSLLFCSLFLCSLFVCDFPLAVFPMTVFPMAVFRITVNMKKACFLFGGSRSSLFTAWLPGPARSGFCTAGSRCRRFPAAGHGCRIR